MRYVGRLFRLAFLAPDIVEAIVEGRQPISLTAEAVTRNIEMPLEWRSQKTSETFSSPGIGTEFLAHREKSKLCGTTRHMSSLRCRRGGRIAPTGALFAAIQGEFLNLRLMVWTPARLYAASQWAEDVLSNIRKARRVRDGSYNDRIDLAKSAFAVSGADGSGRVVMRRQLRPAQILSFMRGLPRCTVGMEASGGAQLWLLRMRTTSSPLPARNGKSQNGLTSRE